MEPEGETRVAIVPGSMKKLMKSGFEVVVQKGAGSSANHSDSEYADAGATIGSREEVLSCEILISIRIPEASELSKGQIVQQVGTGIKGHAPDATIIMVTNPLDLMTYHMQKVTGFPTNRVIGQAGVLDSARMAHFIALELNCAEEDVSPMVLGGHGDTMVPLPRYTTVGGIPITQLMSEDRIEAISARTAGGGGEIVKLLERGSAFYAPGSAAAIMAEAVLNDRRRVIPASCHLTGQYGLEDVYIGVPCILGANGVETIFELDLSDAELESLQGSANFYKGQLKDILGY